MTSTVEIDQAKLEVFTNQVFGDLSASYGAVMASLGVRLGLYEALAGAGPLTPNELAERTDCAERYVREWLNSQVAGGYLDYHPDTDTYEMSPEQAAVLVDRTSPALMAPAFHVVASLWHGEDRAIEAFRTGAGVPWGTITSACSAASRRSSAPATQRRWFRIGCLRSTASSSGSRPGQRLPTSAADTAIRPC
jgi:hypothetical protein